MKSLLSLLFSLILEVSILTAQSEYLPGLIIKNNGDTVKGNLFLAATKENCQKCVFKLVPTNEIEIYLPGEIKSFKFDDGYFYRSHMINVDGENKKVFLEWAVKGSMNLYFYVSTKSGIHYFVEKGDSGFNELHNSIKEFYGTDNTRRLQEGKEYTVELAGLLKDQPAVLPDIYKSTFNSKSLINISKDYQKLACPNEQCQVFERPKRKLIIYLGILTGFTNSSLKMPATIYYYPINADAKFFQFNSCNTYELGALVNISNLDFLSPRISFLTVLTYSHINYKLLNYGTVYNFSRTKFAEFIKYSFMLGKLRPSLAVGPAINYRWDAHYYSINVFIPPNHQVFLEFDKFLNKYNPGINGQLGFEYLLSNKIALNLYANYEIYPQFIGNADDKSYSQNINVILGLSYRLN